jgi:hypothetical protein
MLRQFGVPAPRLVLHLLNRLGYGPRPGEIRRVLDRGIEQYVAEQLDPSPDVELNPRLAPFPTLNYSIAQALTLTSTRGVQLLDDAFSSKLIRAVHSRNQLEEVLVDFWFNHFNVYIIDGFQRYSTIAYERDAIRPHALGRFRDLLRATAEHPAMLYYLDNYVSTVTRVDPETGLLRQGLNENYGRELLELHTVGVEAGYSQEDVFDAARCFTGWTIDDVRSSGRFIYRNRDHDTGSKHVFGLHLPAGGGRDDGERLLDYLARHPATARFVCRRLVERFVSDDPPERLVSRCATRFLSSDGDIRAVMQALIGSPEFWAEASNPGKPRNPFEFVVSALRALDAQVTRTGFLARALQGMGMPLYGSLPPTGYSNKGADWLNPSSHLTRMNFALDLAFGMLGGVSVDPAGLVRGHGADPGQPSAIAGFFSEHLFARAMPPGTLAAVSSVDAGSRVSVAARAAGLCLASPAFQRR